MEDGTSALASLLSADFFIGLFFASSQPLEMVGEAILNVTG
jgi:hypothetical protein